MATIDQILKGITQPQYFANIMAKHKANGVPIESWLSSENIGLALTEVMSLLMAQLRGTNTDPKLYAGVTYLVASSFLQFATGDGLTIFSESQYSNSRLPATATQGIIRINSAPSSSAYNIVPGQLIIGSTLNPKLTYTNVTGGALVSGGFLELTYRATQAGSTYNVSNSHPMVLKTSLPGVTVNNPLYPSGVNWITSVGTDEESDSALIKRNSARWGTTGSECNAESLKWWATLPPSGYTSSPVKYVRILENFAINSYGTGYWPGCITVVLGNDSGALVPADRAAVEQNFYDPEKFGITRQIYFVDMTFITVTISAVIDIYKESGASIASVTEQVNNSLENFENFIQKVEIITPQKIGARIEDANKFAIKNVQLNSPLTTITPTYSQKIKFILGPMVYRIV